MFQDCFDRSMLVNYHIKFVIEDRERFIDIVSMDRIPVELLKMMNKCIIGEIRVVMNFHFKKYNFFPWYTKN